MAVNRGGASWMYRMPGQLGASVRMNARCYGGEISQIVSQVITIDTDGILKTYSFEDVFKGYKSTLLMNKPEIVVAARLFLPQKVSADKLIQHMHECEADRHKKSISIYQAVAPLLKTIIKLENQAGKCLTPGT